MFIYNSSHILIYLILKGKRIIWSKISNSANYYNRLEGYIFFLNNIDAREDLPK